MVVLECQNASARDSYGRPQQSAEKVWKTPPFCSKTGNPRSASIPDTGLTAITSFCPGTNEEGDRID
jgi:hypothetical protein